MLGKNIKHNYNGKNKLGYKSLNPLNNISACYLYTIEYNCC